MTETTESNELRKPKGLLASRDLLCQQYHLALLDLDGVIYRGKNPVEFASDSVTQAAQAGMTITYTTNNPSRFPQVVAAQIQSFGLECRPQQVITSAIVAARMLSDRIEHGSKVLVVGGEHLKNEVHGQGFEVVDSAQDHPAAVLMGWFPQIGWTQLAQACFAIEAGAQFFCTNHDLTLPREYGLTPGIGTFVNAVAQATGRQPVAMAGKPESAMYDVERDINAQGSHKLVPVQESLPIGDRLDTDIEAANRGGYDSLCVLTGVSHARDLLLAGPMLRPTYISRDLRGLLEKHHAPVMLSDGFWHLRGWTARIIPDERDGHAAQLIVTRDRDEKNPRSSLDALRVCCQAAWAYADSGHDPYRLELPEFDL
jgi:glycerol 3-phosphatase-2